MSKGTIAILTGGGDVPGLNPAIRAITLRAIKEGYRVIGIKRGWAGLLDINPDKKADNSDNFIELSSDLVNKVGRTGGTFLHTSRTRPTGVKKNFVPEHLSSIYNEEVNDLTKVAIENIEWLNIDYLIPIGGDDTLEFAVELYRMGVKVVAIPKTMDNDVAGTDYCIGFSTCVTRTIQLTNQIRTSAGSHERLLLIEVFGRNTGFTAILPTLAGAANRCVIPEHPFEIEQLAELLIEDRRRSSSKYSVALVSEGATYKGGHGQVKASDEIDMYGNPKLGGVAEEMSNQIQKISGKYNAGRDVSVISQKLGYLVRGGDPDSMDSIVPMVFGNLALELVLKGQHGRLVCIKEGRYGNVSLDVVKEKSKKVNIARFYDTDRLRPKYKSFEFQPMLIMTRETL
jgi:6-phosphofructokinase 1